MSVDCETRLEEGDDVMQTVHCIVTQILLLWALWIPQQDTNYDTCVRIGVYVYKARLSLATEENLYFNFLLLIRTCTYMCHVFIMLYCVTVLIAT